MSGKYNYAVKSPVKGTTAYTGSAKVVDGNCKLEKRDIDDREFPNVDRDDMDTLVYTPRRLYIWGYMRKEQIILQIHRENRIHREEEALEMMQVAEKIMKSSLKPGDNSKGFIKMFLSLLERSSVNEKVKKHDGTKYIEKAVKEDEKTIILGKNDYYLICLAVYLFQKYPTQDFGVNKSPDSGLGIILNGTFMDEVYSTKREFERKQEKKNQEAKQKKSDEGGLINSLRNIL